MSGPVVGVVGGGQLARMMAGPATALGIHLRVLVEDSGSAAAAPAHSSQIGRAADLAAVLDLAEACDVVTFEHEHIPAEVFDGLASHHVTVRPSAQALLHAQDKIVMRRRLTELGLPVPQWTPIATGTDLEGFLEDVGGAAVVKTARGGYDGKGVRVVRSPDEVADWLSEGTDLLAEALVPFARELAVLLARRPNGEIRSWPVVESVQRNGVCDQVIAPAPGISVETTEEAERIGRAVADGLGVVGVLAVELFEVQSGDGSSQLLVNELAMRPHNSGHWTIDGSVTGQFEQHLRAVLDLPLGDTASRSRWSVMANVLGSSLEEPTSVLADVLEDPSVRVHLYDKDVQPGRKLGHVTVSGEDLDEVIAKATRAAGILRGETVTPSLSWR